MISVTEDKSLAQYSTMRLGGTAAYLVEVASEDELTEAIAWARERSLPIRMIGSGANIVFTDDGYKGLVVVNRIMGREQESATKDSVTFAVGGGENWDDYVAFCVQKGLSGIETLSLIPGTVGAAPVQNIGAYGQQVSDSLLDVTAYDLHSHSFVTLTHDDCHFKYRSSRFNREDKGQFLIVRVRLRLSTSMTVSKPYYADLDAYLSQHAISHPTPSDIRDAVISIRSQKLPDPKLVANCGSFFYNPVVSPEKFESLKSRFPDLKSHQTDDGQLKLYAGQLIELAGFKGIHDPETGMAVWPKQALVLVNEAARSTSDLLKFKAKIVDKVSDLFGVTLMQEPELFENA